MRDGVGVTWVWMNEPFLVEFVVVAVAGDDERGSRAPTVGEDREEGVVVVARVMPEGGR